MKAADYQHLVEESWRRPLRAEEQRQLAAWLEQHPEETGTWTEEAALTSALRRLPDAPVASNFTAQVLQAIDRAETSAAREAAGDAGWRRWLLPWLPRLAVASLVIAVAWIGWRQLEHRREGQLASALVQFSAAASAVPEPAVFGDFEVIRRLGQPQPASDEALFAVLTE